MCLCQIAICLKMYVTNISPVCFVINLSNRIVGEREMMTTLCGTPQYVGNATVTAVVDIKMMMM